MKHALKPLDEIDVYEVSLDITTGLPDSKKHALFKSVLQHVKSDHTPVIQFVSALKNEGAAHIAFETAMSAAHNFHQSILFVDASFESEGFLKTLNQQIEHVVFHPAFEDAHPIPVYTQEDTSFSFCKLFKNKTPGFSDEDLKSVFQKLKDYFDVIFMYSESALHDESWASFTHITDGTVMIVEAERTRAPVIKALKNKIESSGGVIVGTILNRRRFHIPRLVHKLFFKT